MRPVILLGVFLVGLAAILTGCASSRSRAAIGFEYQERGEYGKAYAYFKDLTRQYPGNEDFKTYESTARGLAFRQAVGQAQKALTRGDLEGFLQGMKQARTIQPGEKVDMVIQLIEGARMRGESDAKIRQALGGAISPQTPPLDEALVATAQTIGRLILDGKVHDPVAIVDFTVEGAGSPQTPALFRSQLTKALLDRSIGVVEREKIKAVSEEIVRAASGQGQPGVQADQLAGAQALIAGSVQVSGTAPRYQWRVIDVETGKIVFQETQSFLPEVSLTTKDE